MSKSRLQSATLIVACVLALMPAVSHADDQSKSAISSAKWFLAGTNAKEYKAGITNAPELMYANQPSGFIRSTGFNFSGYGEVAEHVPAQQYAGQRVRLNAVVFTDKCVSGVSLWLWALKGKNGLRSADTTVHALIGSNNWSRQELVLDVPKNADTLRISMRLTGRGMALLNDLNLVVIPTHAPSSPELQFRTQP